MRGFTFVELLIVVVIIGAIFSIVSPFSYTLYERYKVSNEAEKVLTILASQKTEAFLYSEEKIITSMNGKLYINGEEAFRSEKVFLEIKEPVKFYATGTTTGGEVKIIGKTVSFIIEIKAPFGGFSLKRQ